MVIIEGEELQDKAAKRSLQPINYNKKIICYLRSIAFYKTINIVCLIDIHEQWSNWENQSRENPGENFCFSEYNISSESRLSTLNFQPHINVIISLFTRLLHK